MEPEDKVVVKRTSLLRPDQGESVMLKMLKKVRISQNKPENNMLPAKTTEPLPQLGHHYSDQSSDERLTENEEELVRSKDKVKVATELIKIADNLISSGLLRSGSGDSSVSEVRPNREVRPSRESGTDAIQPEANLRETAPAVSNHQDSTPGTVAQENKIRQKLVVYSMCVLAVGFIQFDEFFSVKYVLIQIVRQQCDIISVRITNYLNAEGTTKVCYKYNKGV